MKPHMNKNKISWTSIWIKMKSCGPSYIKKNLVEIYINKNEFYQKYLMKITSNNHWVIKFNERDWHELSVLGDNFNKDTTIYSTQV